jgi:hypothetical protein
LTACSDGKLLLQLMEIVGAAELPKPSRGNMRVCLSSFLSPSFAFFLVLVIFLLFMIGFNVNYLSYSTLNWNCT